MGHGTRNDGIKTFTPDDTDDEFYLEANYFAKNLHEIFEKCQEKWPGISMENIEIEAKHIHTDCIGDGRYDPGDYTNYLLIKKVGN